MSITNQDTQQQRIIIEARRFADAVIRPGARQFDRQERLPREIINEMAKRRYLLAGLSVENGGLGLDPVSYGLFTEEIGKACCATRSLITVQSSLVGETLSRWGSKAQKDKWLMSIASAENIGAFALSEPDVGSDARDVQTNYRKNGSDYIVTGRKKWISFAAIADFFIVIAACGPEMSAFIVERDRAGVKTIPQKGLLGNRAAHLAEIELDEVRIPEENIIGSPGSGYAFIVNHALDHGRYSIAWAGVAIAQEALDAMVAYARNRNQFGQKIARFQLIQRKIADAVTKTKAARALCLSAGQMRSNKHPDAVAETTIAKYFASKAAMAVASDSVQVHGGNGCSDRYPVERLFREAKVLEIIEGTSQIQQLMIAKFGLRKFGQQENKTEPNND
jgi:alkylation response protein AidB-like acyl-CoA dehydrogenase